MTKRSEVTVLVQPTKVDLMIAAVVRELEARRSELESDADLRAVTVTCRLNRVTNQPRAVIVTRESEQEFR